jgi:hypothetical protein
LNVGREHAVNKQGEFESINSKFGNRLRFVGSWF